MWKGQPALVHCGGPGLSSTLQPGERILEAVQAVHLEDTFTEGVGSLWAR